MEDIPFVSEYNSMFRRTISLILYWDFLFLIELSTMKNRAYVIPSIVVLARLLITCKRADQSAGLDVSIVKGLKQKCIWFSGVWRDYCRSKSAICEVKKGIWWWWRWIPGDGIYSWEILELNSKAEIQGT